MRHNGKNVTGSVLHARLPPCSRILGNSRTKRMRRVNAGREGTKIVGESAYQILGYFA